MKKRDLAQIRHFIWDFDGTLFDTYPTIIEILRSALQEYGCDCDPAEAMVMMLDTIGFARDHYADIYGIDRDALKQTYMVYHHKLIPQFLATPFPFAAEVLDRIGKRGGYHYIFTHRDSGETDAYLKKHGLRGYFREIVCPDSPHFAMKPSPDAILYLMEKYGMTGEDAVMVGDRDCDLESARRAGIGTVHKVCPIAPEQLACDWKFEDFREMLALIS